MDVVDFKWERLILRWGRNKECPPSLLDELFAEDLEAGGDVDFEI